MAHHVRKVATMPAAAARLTQSCSGSGGGGGNRYASQLTPLQTLQKLEISKHRAEKALAATGNRDAQLAVDWLLSHVHDPTLDAGTRREYILYACPTGPFVGQLETFWQRTRAEHGWNGAHNFLPHITLVSFFQAPDEFAPQLADALRLAVDMAAASCGAADAGGNIGSGSGASLLDGRRPLQLELSTSDNFMGFYVRDGDSNDANMLQRLALQYVQNVKEVLGELISEKYEQMDALVTCFPWCGGVTNTHCIPRSSRSISLEPHDNKLHLTLAYKFPPDQHAVLHAAAAAQLQPAAATQWELRLYSRDPQLAVTSAVAAPLVVHRALQSHPAGDGQLELRTGDFVYLVGGNGGGGGGGTEQSTNGDHDEWVQAISHRTGCTGVIPLGRTERCAESDAWTLHQTVSIAAPSPPPQRPDVSFIQQLIRQSALCDLAQLNDSDTLLAAAAATAARATADGSGGPQQLYVMRHGERVDFTFGPDWVRHAFQPASGDAANSVYRNRDLNMPTALPQRANAPVAWSLDGPLTEIGCHQAWLTGRRLREAGVRMRHVYCSPSFRCVQTCWALLDGLGQQAECAIRVEPALFEWLVWYEGEHGLPVWMTVAELRAAGFNVDEEYVPMLDVAAVQARVGESCVEFYERNSAVTERAVRESAEDGGHITFVGHAVTLDSCTRQLTTGRQRTFADMTRLMPRIAYASLVLAERQPNADWLLTAPPCHGMTHNRNGRFDWRVLTTEE